MTTIADPRTAVAAFLKTEVGSLVGGRVFRPELPRGEDSNMPRGCIVVFSGGGGHLFGRDRLGVFDSIMDIACYGSTRLEAENIADAAMYAMREMGHEEWPKSEAEGAPSLLHWIRIAGGVKSTIDPQTLWPFAMITVQVMHSTP